MSSGPVESDPSDGRPVLEFATAGAFEDWLERHHGEAGAIWLKIARKGGGMRTPTLEEATEVALCFGWIDSRMHGYDERCYLLRFQPRRRRSPWSESNKRRAERLIAQGRMRERGLAEVEAARADGRW